MAHGSSAEVTAKWLRNIQAAQPEMQAGVDRLTTSPGQSAAAKKQKWINALMDAATQDKWSRNVQSVSLQQWQAAMKDYGINRVAQGAQAKQAKMQTALDSLRALAMMRGMRGYQRPGA